MLGGVLLLGRGAGCSLGVSRVAPADWRQTGYSIWSCVNAKPSVLPLSCLPSPVSPRVSNAGIHTARWAENGDRQLWCVSEKVLGLTAQWQHSLLSFQGRLQGISGGAFSSPHVGSSPSLLSTQQGGFIAKFRPGQQMLDMLTGVGFLCHRVGVNPEDFLRVLQKTQLHRIFKEAIMQVAAPPGSAPALVGWVVGPVLTAHRLEGAQTLGIALPLPMADLAFLLQKVRSYEGRPMLADEFQKLFDEVDKGVIKEVTRSGPCHLSSLG